MRDNRATRELCKITQRGFAARRFARVLWRLRQPLWVTSSFFVCRAWLGRFLLRACAHCSYLQAAVVPFPSRGAAGGYFLFLAVRRYLFAALQLSGSSQA